MNENQIADLQWLRDGAACLSPKGPGGPEASSDSPARTKEIPLFSTLYPVRESPKFFHWSGYITQAVSLMTFAQKAYAPE